MSRAAHIIQRAEALAAKAQVRPVSESPSRSASLLSFMEDLEARADASTTPPPVIPRQSRASVGLSNCDQGLADLEVILKLRRERGIHE